MKSAHAVALLLALCPAVLSPSHAAAQLNIGLGNLVVDITSPPDGATVSGTVTVSASVTIIGSLTVRDVVFKVDGVTIGTDTSAPYSIPWDTRTASNGIHTVTATARDTLGLTSSSDQITVTVFNDKTPPTVAVTAPAAGATVSGSIAISANASDNVGVVGVQFKVDGVNVGAEDTSAPYSVSWNTTTASNGSHTLTAVARDAAGNASTSAAVTVTVSNDSTPPTVAVTSPAAGATVSGSIAISANASDNVGVVGVQFKVDGVNVGAEDTSAPYSVSWNTTTAGNGSHTLTAVARDAAGNASASAGVTVTVFNDSTAPTVALTAPAAGATVSGSIAISANASDNVGVVGVQFKVDGVNVGAEDTSAPYAVSWNTTTVSNGSHTLTAVARDAAGNASTSAAVTVTVSNDSTPPTVAVTAPAAGATVSGTITVTASASDNVGVAGVQFKLDGANLGAEDTAAPYAVSWNTATASAGPHTLTAVARDAAGNATTSAAVTVTVSNDTTAPSVTLSTPSAGATVSGTITVSATASDNVGVSGVQFKLDGANLGAEDTTAPYSVAWNTTGAADGSHTLTAVARDAAGNVTTSAPVTVTVDNAAPAVAITAPASGATVSGSVTVSADASDSGGIAGVQFTLDGANLGAEDTTAPYSVVWDTTTASNGSHTLGAIARDTSGKTKTAVDVVVTVANASDTVVRVEDSSASIAYVGSWAQGNTSRSWSGGTAALATAGPTAAGDPTRATLTFTGTAVRWIGLQGPQTGIARVFLDGALVATVDTYSASEVLGAVLYTTSGLPSTTHTLAIESTGTKNASSSDIFIVIDAFDVTSSSGGSSDTTPPTIAITAPAAGSTVSGAVTVSASASDGSGIAGVQFKVDGVNVGAEDTTAPYGISWDTTSVPDGSHTLTAVARDNAGNVATSTGVAVTVSNGGGTSPSSVMTRFENTDSAIVYTAGSPASAPPDWWHGSRSRGWSGETSAFNRSEGARASFTFTGTAVQWIGFRAPWAGIARVFLDGAFAGEIDLYAPTEQAQATVYSATGLAAGAHTIVVEATGRKNASAVDNAVVVDAFDVGPPVPPPVSGTRIEDSSSAIAFGTGWGPAGVSGPAWSGGSAAASSTAGARATVTFTGTTVSLIGLRGPQTGIARVFLDGAFHALIDTYSPSEIQAVVFTETNLAPGVHELTIEVTGARNAAATNHLVVVDAFDVRSRFEEVDPAVRYTGTWVAGDFSDNWSGTSGNYGSGSAARSATAGARAEFSFSGTSVTWIGYRGPLGGIARVHVDGALVSEVDTYSATKEVRAALFTASGLTAGAHTLTIEVTGLKNAAAGAAIVIVDAFDVTLPASVPVVRRFQQTDAAYPAGAWQQSSENFLFTGGTVAFASAAGARAEFTFTGRSVRWIGYRAFEGGIARVYVDGVAVADVDTFAGAQEEYQAVIFSVAGLAPGTHTLAIEVTGLKNAASSGTRVVVDAFDVW